MSHTFDYFGDPRLTELAADLNDELVRRLGDHLPQGMGPFGWETVIDPHRDVVTTWAVNTEACYLLSGEPEIAALANAYLHLESHWHKGSRQGFFITDKREYHMPDWYLDDLPEPGLQEGGEEKR